MKLKRAQGGKHHQQMGKALAAARRAGRRGEVPVGAALFVQGQCVATAGNQSHRSQDPLQHAEIRVLRRASKKLKTWRLHGAALYVTAEPCVLCASACVLYRVGEIVYGCPEPKFGGVVSRARIFKSGLNHHPEVRGGIRASEASELLKAFFRVRRKS